MPTANLLTVVVDVNTGAWQTRHGDAQLMTLRDTFEALVVFFNAHLLMHRQNQLRVVASHDGGPQVLYSGGGNPIQAREQKDGDEPQILLCLRTAVRRQRARARQ